MKTIKTTEIKEDIEQPKPAPAPRRKKIELDEVKELVVSPGINGLQVGTDVLLYKVNELVRAYENFRKQVT